MTNHPFPTSILFTSGPANSASMATLTDAKKRDGKWEAAYYARFIDAPGHEGERLERWNSCVTATTPHAIARDLAKRTRGDQIGRVKVLETFP